MDKTRLKVCAQLLEEEIKRHRETSADARFLSHDICLKDAIARAKTGTIDGPTRSDGWIRWIMESNIQDIETLKHVFLDFIYLLRGDEDVLGYIE
jgi:hypothetical protein